MMVFIVKTTSNICILNKLQNEFINNQFLRKISYTISMINFSSFLISEKKTQISKTTPKFCVYKFFPQNKAGFVLMMFLIFARR